MAMRAGLRGHLEGLNSSRSWEHITDQIGMFCYTGLTQEEVGFVCFEGERDKARERERERQRAVIIK